VRSEQRRASVLPATPASDALAEGRERAMAARQAPDRIAQIRALERSDIPETAALFELVLGSGVREAKPARVRLFEREFLDNPWVDRELPSLVAVDERGRVVGFIGVEVRRMRFGDRAARAVWSHHFVVDPPARRLGVGAVLLRQILNGAQDVTLTDSASEITRKMWKGLGGQTLDLRGIHWVRVFRPWRVAAHLIAGKPRPRLGTALRGLVDVLDAATAVGAGRYLEPDPVNYAATPLTPQAMLDLLPTFTRRLTLYPDYDEAFLSWLFTELVKVERRGRLVAHLVHDPSGQPLGWYLYYLRPGWRSEVLQVVAAEPDVGRVLDHLLSHAYRHGSAVVRGRLEPGLVEAVVRRRCLLWHRGGALVHSRDPALLCALQSDGSLATRLEGEWWSDAPL
jgi:GNAT superfamily N-acetyltransferase